MSDCESPYKKCSDGKTMGHCRFTRYTFGGLSWRVCAITEGAQNGKISEECEQLAKDNCYICGDGPTQPKPQYDWTPFPYFKSRGDCAAIIDPSIIINADCGFDKCLGGNFKIIKSKEYPNRPCVTPHGTHVPSGVDVLEKYNGRGYIFRCYPPIGPYNDYNDYNLWVFQPYVCPPGSRKVLLEYIDGIFCKCMMSDSSTLGGATIVEPIVPPWEDPFADNQ